MHDDDQERSRSIPARTKLGKRAAAIEKFPCLGTPLIAFCGLLTVPFWMYRQLPLALIDLMLTDLPRVEFGEEKITTADIEEAKIRDKKMKERIKNGNRIGLSMKNLVSSNTAFLQNKAKKGD
jgi:hypothetical protein